jgi:dTDP-4-amino-4,6-dideoxygalactose transaminase
MTNPKIWLSSPHMSGKELEYVQEAFQDNWIAPLGPHVNGFEEALCTKTGAKFCAALSSGTSALHLALILLGVQQEDTVFCQSMTFSASANPIAYQGAKPIFIDSENDSWNMDPLLLEKAIQETLHAGKNPKVIIVVHLYGMPAKMDEINAVALKYNIPVIEDAAEAIGSTLNNQPCGSLAHFGILSFNGNKIITTSGGGALLSNDGALIEKARYLATQARDPAPHYQHSEIGFNYRMSNVLAGIGRGQLEVLNNRVEARRSNFEKYKSYFNTLSNKGYIFQFQPETKGAKSNRWLTCIVIDPKFNKGITRENLRLALDSQNIESRPLWKPMHQQPVFEHCKFYGSGVSDYLFENGLCLPSGSNLTEEDFERIFACIDSVFI